MCSSQLMFQKSWDLGMYLPSELESEDTLSYQSPEALMSSIDFSQIPVSHRMEPNFFDPLNDDMEASSALSDDEVFSTNNDNFFMNDLASYFQGSSTVIPHTPNLSNKSVNSPLSPTPSESNSISSPNSPSCSNRFNTRKFLVFDVTTGRERRPLLHEFIRLLLEYAEYSHIAEYVDRKQGIFKLHKTKDISELWKQVKGRNSDNRKSIFL
jgi:hypothetical protein